MEFFQTVPIADDPTALPTLLFSVGKNVYGINSRYVHGIETLGEYTTMVGSEPQIRGGIFYQDEFIPLIDMRKLFGMDSQIAEFEKSVLPEQRIRDHENWVATLEASVRDHTEFKLTDDPHQCAFGKWYYSFKTDNNVLRHQLSAIEAPHEAIHNTARVVKRLALGNQYDEAMSVIRDMKDSHFQTTLHILSSLRKIMESSLKELYVVIDASDGLKGLIVDSIVGVEELDHTLPLPESLSASPFIECLGRRKKDNTAVTLLNNMF